ncbi:MAG: hypothetical protein GXO07_06400 [Crenarchaeota archaeon]|nr:hypothetical protein [Thermoproteota archaeon]
MKWLKAVLLLLAVPIASACVDVNVYPAGRAELGTPLKVYVVIESYCDVEATLKVKLNNLTLTSVSGFESAVGDLLLWKGYLRNGTEVVLSFTAVPTSQAPEVSYELTFDGISVRGTVALGAPKCLDVKAGIGSLRYHFMNFRVPDGYVLGVAISNTCADYLNVPLRLSFVTSNPSSVVLSYCESWVTEVVTVPTCAKLEGKPVKECALWNAQGPFVPVLETLRPGDVRCSYCELVGTEGNSKVYKCSGCERFDEVYVRVERRLPVCLQSECSSWTQVPRKVRYCKRWISEVLEGAPSVSTLRLAPGSVVLLRTYYSRPPDVFMLGSLASTVKIPVVVVEVGNEKIAIAQEVANIGFHLTLMLYTMSILLAVFAILHLVT